MTLLAPLLTAREHSWSRRNQPEHDRRDLACHTEAVDWAVDNLFRIAVLGPVGMADEDGFTAVRGHQGSLLAILASKYPNAVEQDVVIDALWPVNAPSSAKGSLGVALHRLRSRLPDAAMIVTDGSTYRLDVAEKQLDAADFQNRIASVGSDDPADRAEDLSAALDLWRGRPFQPVGDDPAFSAVSSELLELKRHTEEHLLEALLDAGKAKDAANRAATLVEAEPYRERRWELLMLALYRSSRQAEALRAGQRARQTLGDDLGLEPGPALQELEAAILNQDPSLILDKPEVLSEVDGLAEIAPRPAIVPAHDGPFVGRVDELAEMASAIEGHSWVAVTGPPGVGKTRLVAHFCLGDSGRRILWVDCARKDEQQVFGELSKQLGVRPSERDAIGALTPALASEPTVVVLDNPAPEVLGRVSELVSAGDGASAITITRSTATQSYDFTNISLTGVDVEAAASMLLAESTLDDEAVVAAVIDEIGTIPLHVELFAAQLRFASVEELLEDWSGPVEHVDDRLAKALDWSVDLRSEAEQQLYERLGVFAGWSSATDIAGGVGLPVALVRRHLTTLIEAGLVRPSRSGKGSGHIRYRLDLSMRSHAVERLRARGELDVARSTHASYFYELALQRGAQSVGPEEQAAVEHLHRVIPQLHKALDYLLDTGDIERAIEFVLALHEYSFFRLDFATLGWPHKVAEVPAAQSSDNYPELLATAGLTAWASDRLPRARSYAERAIAVAEERNQPHPITALRTQLNVAATTFDATATADAMFALIGAAERDGTERDQADCLVNQAIGSTFMGDHKSALRAALRSLELAENSENPTSIAWAKYAMGCAELLRHPEPALLNFAESLRLAQTVQNRWVIASALSGVATAARLGGRASDATGPLQSLLDIWVGMRKERFFARTLNEIALVLLELEQPDEAGTVLGWARSYTADALLLPEDRALLRKVVTELVPPLLTDVFDIRLHAAGASEFLVAAQRQTETVGP